VLPWCFSPSLPQCYHDVSLHHYHSVTMMFLSIIHHSRCNVLTVVPISTVLLNITVVPIIPVQLSTIDLWGVIVSHSIFSFHIHPRISEGGATAYNLRPVCSWTCSSLHCVCASLATASGFVAILWYHEISPRQLQPYSYWFNSIVNIFCALYNTYKRYELLKLVQCYIRFVSIFIFLQAD